MKKLKVGTQTIDSIEQIKHVLCKYKKKYTKQRTTQVKNGDSNILGDGKLGA